MTDLNEFILSFSRNYVVQHINDISNGEDIEAELTEDIYLVKK